MRCSLNPLGAEEELVEQLRVDEVDHWPGYLTSSMALYPATCSSSTPCARYLVHQD